VTRTDELAKLRDQHADPDDLATVVRNRLGLSHYDQNELLVEVEYPPQILDAMHFVAPTFLEGSAGVIFRAQHCTDDWGRAVDLVTLDDGLPEAVHRPVPFASDFRIRRIGRIKTDPGFTYGDVVTRAPHPWTEMPEDFKAFVDALMAE
jgi:hypothetical protein